MGGHLPLLKAAALTKPLFPLFPRITLRGTILSSFLALAACAGQPAHVAQAPAAAPGWGRAAAGPRLGGGNAWC